MYVGLGFVRERGAIDHLKALKEGPNGTVSFLKLREAANHLSTNGDNKNVSEYEGLWKLIEDEQKDKDPKFPMLKSVYTVHSSALTFKIFCKEVTKVDVLVRKLSLHRTFNILSCICRTYN